MFEYCEKALEHAPHQLAGAVPTSAVGMGERRCCVLGTERAHHLAQTRCIVVISILVPLTDKSQRNAIARAIQ